MLGKDTINKAYRTTFGTNATDNEISEIQKNTGFYGSSFDSLTKALRTSPRYQQLSESQKREFKFNESDLGQSYQRLIKDDKTLKDQATKELSPGYDQAIKTIRSQEPLIQRRYKEALKSLTNQQENINAQLRATQERYQNQGAGFDILRDRTAARYDDAERQAEQQRQQQEQNILKRMQASGNLRDGKMNEASVNLSVNYADILGRLARDESLDQRQIEVDRSNALNSQTQAEIRIQGLLNEIASKSAQANIEMDSALNDVANKVAELQVGKQQAITQYYNALQDKSNAARMERANKLEEIAMYEAALEREQKRAEKEAERWQSEYDLKVDSLEQDADQFNRSLALDERQFEESVRSNKASEDIARMNATSDSQEDQVTPGDVATQLIQRMNAGQFGYLDPSRADAQGNYFGPREQAAQYAQMLGLPEQEAIDMVYNRLFKNDQGVPTPPQESGNLNYQTLINTKFGPNT